jgi:hypothetical protein
MGLNSFTLTRSFSSSRRNLFSKSREHQRRSARSERRLTLDDVPFEISISRSSNNTADCCDSICSKHSGNSINSKKDTKEYDMLEAYHSSNSTPLLLRFRVDRQGKGRCTMNTTTSISTSASSASSDGEFDVDDIDSSYSISANDELDDLLRDCRLLRTKSQITRTSIIIKDTDDSSNKKSKATVIKKSVTFHDRARVCVYEASVLTNEEKETLYYTPKQRTALEKQLRRQINLIKTVPNLTVGCDPNDFVASIRGIEFMFDSTMQTGISSRQMSVVATVLAVQDKQRQTILPGQLIDQELLRKTSMEISSKSIELALDFADYSAALELLLPRLS